MCNQRFRFSLSSSLRDYIYSGAEQQKAIDSIPEQRKNISDNIAKLEKSITSDQGKEILKKVNTARQLYVASQDKFLELLKAGKRDEIVVLMQGDLRKSQADYLGAINALVDLQTELMNKSGKDADEMATAAERLVLILSIVAVLLTLAFAFLITRSITGPTSKLVDGANKMAAGDFGFKLDVDSKDEVGALANAVRAMQAAVQAGSEAQAEDTDKLVVSGERNLLTVQDFSNDLGSLRRLFDLFEQKTQLMRLLDGSNRAEGVNIYIGGESQVVPFEELSVVSAPYQIDGQVVGTLGVIGPTRMAYDRMIEIVDITSRLVSNALSQK